MIQQRLHPVGPWVNALCCQPLHHVADFGTDLRRHLRFAGFLVCFVLFSDGVTEIGEECVEVRGTAEAPAHVTHGWRRLLVPSHDGFKDPTRRLDVETLVWSG